MFRNCIAALLVASIGLLSTGQLAAQHIIRLEGAAASDLNNFDTKFRFNGFVALEGEKKIQPAFMAEASSGWVQGLAGVGYYPTSALQVFAMAGLERTTHMEVFGKPGSFYGAKEGLVMPRALMGVSVGNYHTYAKVSVDAGASGTQFQMKFSWYNFQLSANTALRVGAIASGNKLYHGVGPRADLTMSGGKFVWLSMNYDYRNDRESAEVLGASLPSRTGIAFGMGYDLRLKTRHTSE